MSAEDNVTRLPDETERLILALAKALEDNYPSLAVLLKKIVMADLT